MIYVICMWTMYTRSIEPCKSFFKLPHAHCCSMNDWIDGKPRAEATKSKNEKIKHNARLIERKYWRKKISSKQIFSSHMALICGKNVIRFRPSEYLQSFTVVLATPPYTSQNEICSTLNWFHFNLYSWMTRYHWI